MLLLFSKNDLDFELSYRINYEDLQSRPLFPHIFIKNLSFQVNFGQLKTVCNSAIDFINIKKLFFRTNKSNYQLKVVVNKFLQQRSQLLLHMK